MPPKPVLGILAGGGDLPRRIIKTCRDQDREFFVIAFKDQTPEETVKNVPHEWVRLGAAGKAVKLLHQAGVKEVVMAGPLHRPSLVALRPDAWAAKVFAKAGLKAMGDDGLLSSIIKVLEEKEGFKVVGPDDLLPDLLAPEGVYGVVEPDEQALADIHRGFEVARGIGALDVGQAAVVQQGIVLAVEAVEGTDAMIKRAGDMRREGGFGGVVVKISKSDQESRADLPTIGTSTIKSASAAGLRGVAVQAGGALIIDREGVIKAADQAKIFVMGVKV